MKANWIDRSDVVTLWVLLGSPAVMLKSYSGWVGGGGGGLQNFCVSPRPLGF